MRVLFFGMDPGDAAYPRNRNLVSALKACGVEVFEIHGDLVGTYDRRMEIVRNPRKVLPLFLALLKSCVALTRAYARIQALDAILVGHPGHVHVFLARIIASAGRQRPLVVHDVFLPLHEALVEDRGLLKKAGAAAKAVHLLETWSCRAADLCLVDTGAHALYLQQTHGLHAGRVLSLFVGPTIRPPAPFPVRAAPGPTFKLLFVGTYIPLHGAEIILQAARVLRDIPGIRFLLVGRGQTRAAMEGLAVAWGLPNVLFLDWVPTEGLGDFLRAHDLALGVFGTTPKTGRVIPSKVYDICAAGMPFVTADTPAIREVFTHGKNAWLVPPGDPEALARAILALRADPGLRDRIAAGAFRVSWEAFSLERIGRRLLTALQERTALPMSLSAP